VSNDEEASVMCLQGHTCAGESFVNVEVESAG
jgi:hypothetical protein